ncbi:MAG: L-seryl-tRNA(Sec) selenium transferase [Pirellulales bacterium]|nr:L-seryl-tRNA(Sec) selenium transferase [Pirellulales bacterium]
MSTSSRQDRLRQIPAVEVVLRDPAIEALAPRVPRVVLIAAVRAAIARARERLLNDRDDAPDKNALRDHVVADAARQAAANMRPQCGRAINATGIILHTGLGRAVLPRAAVERIAHDLAGYSILQLDLETGRRGRRDARIAWLAAMLTGAEAATVVNNNAAATTLVLNTIAAGKEVIVSRGQLVEIGGSFRLPEVMAASGAKLVEVGTTNKTHPRDYEAAITENTAAIMRVHPSNFRIVGFTAEVPLPTLAQIARARGLVLYDDLGAGPLVDVAPFGFQPEPLLAESIAAGADLVSCSTDKLIGGSQGGLILGRTKHIDAVRKNPFARIVRAGKLTLAALEATLDLFLDPAQARRDVPTLRMLARGLDDLDRQARRIAQTLADRGLPADADVIDGSSQMGSGSLPTQDLPTRLVAIAPRTGSPDELARRLRLHRPPVIARVQDDRVLIDPRTLLDGDDEILIEALASVLESRGPL